MQSPGKRAFTIIELMVVMIIIAVVVSILIPALGHARSAARDASTQGLMNNIVSAAGKFEQDNRRHPGHFSAREMGDAANLGQGFSGMENVMLDIAGGVVGTAPATQPTGSVLANPTGGSAPNVYVDTTRIGAAGAYFVPPKNFLRAQTIGDQQISNATFGHAAAEGTDQIPDVIGAHGDPLLAWVEDEAATAIPINPNASPPVLLSRRTAGPTNIARYYWASNAAFLQANSLGKKGRDQNFVAADVTHSLIGGGIAAPQLEERLDGFLGNPNFPFVDSANPNAAPAHPSAGRSGFMIHSAGRDGFYFGSNERGAKTIDGYALPERVYTAYFKQSIGSYTGPGNTRWTDKNGNVTTDDFTKEFDDLIATASN